MTTNHLRLVAKPPVECRICPDCHHAYTVNPDMVSIAIDIRGVELFEIDDIAQDAALLGDRLSYPPCFFHQEGQRLSSPWANVCKLEGN